MLPQQVSGGAEGDGRQVGHGAVQEHGCGHLSGAAMAGTVAAVGADGRVTSAANVAVTGGGSSLTVQGFAF